MMNVYLCDFHHVFELKKRYSQLETILHFFDLKTLWIWENILCLQKNNICYITTVI